MEFKRAYIAEICVGLLFVVIGFIILWWSKQIVWIQIYPPPWEKRFIESLPFLFWIIGALLILDGLRRN
jgi:hypothetical protein